MLEGVDHVDGGDSLPLGVLGEGDGLGELPGQEDRVDVGQHALSGALGQPSKG